MGNDIYILRVVMESGQMRYSAEQTFTLSTEVMSLEDRLAGYATDMDHELLELAGCVLPTRTWSVFPYYPR